MRIAPVSEIAESAMNSVKYSGEIASSECVLEYLIINSDVFSKKTEARKKPINEIPLPIKDNMQSAVSKSERVVFISFIFFNI